MIVRRLLPEDTPLYVPLRRQALEQEPHSFAASPANDRASSEEFVRGALSDPDQATFGAFAPQLAGMVGIYRDPLIKARHKTHIWGMYVTPEDRGQGTGRMLIEAALEWARDQAGVTQVHLVVSTRTPIARKLYQSLGFSTWGVEPAALCINGELIDDEHMVRLLAGSAGQGKASP